MSKELRTTIITRQEVKIKIEHARTGLGTKVRKLREAKGWNQSQLADAVDVVRSTICQIESKKKFPSYVLRCTLAECFGIKESELR